MHDFDFNSNKNGYSTIADAFFGEDALFGSVLVEFLYVAYLCSRKYLPVFFNNAFHMKATI
jgi:hypothetical protein